MWPFINHSYTERIDVGHENRNWEKVALFDENVPLYTYTIGKQNIMSRSTTSRRKTLYDVQWYYTLNDKYEKYYSSICVQR